MSLDQWCVPIWATYRTSKKSLTIAQAGTTLLLITHHVEEIVPEISRVVFLKDGRIEGDGPTRAMLTAERLGERGARRVVVDGDRDPQPLAEDAAQRHPGERDVHAEPRRARLPVHDARDRDAHGRRVADRPDDLLDLIEEHLGARRLGGHRSQLARRRALSASPARDFRTVVRL